MSLDTSGKSSSQYVSQIEVSVLGPLCLRSQTGQERLGPRLTRLLAVLIIADGEVVSSDRLIDVIWEGSPPAHADNTLKSYVTRLRKALRVDSNRLGFRHPGYELRRLSVSIDTHLFEDELGETRRALRQGEAQRASELILRALQRWRGDAYAGMAEEEWARPEAVRLEELKLNAQHLHVEALLSTGQVRQAVAQALALSQTDPLHEKPRELLMLGLHRSGRQAEAMRVLPQFRETLQTEVGLIPSRELVDLENRIARDDPTLHHPVQRLKGYELGERIGEGTFAVVHRAFQPGIERPVAIKIIRAKFADQPSFIRRFEFEARSIARVEHPNVVPIYDFWREPGAAFLVMRFLRGGSVEGLLRRDGQVSIKALDRILTDIGGALAAAHRAGIVHRDVRPANLLLDDQGTAYLADFGIALEPATLTQPSMISVPHASPEVLRGEAITETADVYSLGTTAFELLVGMTAFADSPDHDSLVHRQLNEPLPSISRVRADISPSVDEVLSRATEKDPSHRHPTVIEFVQDLQLALRSGESAPRSSAKPATRRGPNPYIGLRSFEEADAELYFGREALIEEVLRAMEDHPLVTVVGPSGSGKSSVVRAGVLPAIRSGALAHSEDWYIATMVPGGNPFDALETALLRIATNPPSSLRAQLTEVGGVGRAIRRALPNDNSMLVLFIDQFEELFTQAAQDADTQRFLDELAAAVSEVGGGLRLLTTLRADHYDAPLRNRSIAELVSEGTVTTRPMSAEELERAITQPALHAGSGIEPALAAELISALGRQPAALPLLQFALTEVFDLNRSSNLTLDAFNEVGGFAGAVSARADRLVGASDTTREEIVRRVFGRLITLGDGIEDTRRRTLRSELVNSGDDSMLVEEILDSFGAARLLSFDREPTTREATVEVAHEALLREWPRLRAWLNEDREDLRTLRQLTRGSLDWDNAGRAESDLLRGAKLDSAADFAKRLSRLLTPIERTWVEHSIDFAEEAKRAQTAAIAKNKRQNLRLSRLLMVTACLLLVAVSATILGFILRGRAIEARKDADIGRLVAESAAQAEVDPARSMLLALEANRLRDDIETQGAIHRSITHEMRLSRVIPNFLSTTSRIAFADAAELGIAYSQGSANQQIIAFEPETGTILWGPRNLDQRVEHVAISADGSTVALLLADGAVYLHDNDLQPIGSPTRLDEGIIGMSLSANGATLAVGNSRQIQIINLADGTVLSTLSPQLHDGLGEIAAQQFSSNEDIIFSPRFDLSPNGTRLGILLLDEFSGGEFWAAIDVLDARSGQLLATPMVDASFFPRLRWSVDGRLLLATNREVGRVWSWNDEVTEIDEDIELRGHSDVIDVIVAGVDGRIATASLDETVRIWSADGASPATPLNVTGQVNNLLFTDGGDLLVAQRGGSSLLIGAADPAIVLASYPERFNHIPKSGFYYDAPTESFDAVRIHRLSDGELVTEIEYASVLGSAAIQLPRWSPDGGWMMIYGTEGSVVLLEVLGDSLFRLDLIAAFEEMFGVPFDPTVRLVARPGPNAERVFVAFGTGSESKAAWLNSRTGEIVAGPQSVSGVSAALVLVDGRVVVGGSTQNPYILASDLSADPIEISLAGPMQPYGYNESIDRILFGGVDAMAGLANPSTGEIQFFQGAEGTLASGAISHDGNKVALVSLTTGIQIFDVATMRPVGSPVQLPGANGSEAGTWWEPDGTGVWVSTSEGVTLLSTDPAAWRRAACEIAGRELTHDEWVAFVSAEKPQTSACS